MATRAIVVGEDPRGLTALSAETGIPLGRIVDVLVLDGDGWAVVLEGYPVPWTLRNVVVDASAPIRPRSERDP